MPTYIITPKIRKKVLVLYLFPSFFLCCFWSTDHSNPLGGESARWRFWTGRQNRPSTTVSYCHLCLDLKQSIAWPTRNLRPRPRRTHRSHTSQNSRMSACEWQRSSLKHMQLHQANYENLSKTTTNFHFYFLQSFELELPASCQIGMDGYEIVTKLAWMGMK